MNKELIRMFKCEIPSTKTVPYDKIVWAATEAGYIVDPSIATRDVLAFLKEQDSNFNTSFYKTWSDILKRDSAELFIDQLAHYMTTYGTLTEEEKSKAELVVGKSTINVVYDWNGNGYVPNDNPVRVPLKDYQIIRPTTAEEVRDRILDLFTSGIALHAVTIHACVQFLKEYGFLDQIDVNKIKNKEAQAAVYCLRGDYPEDEFTLLRCIVWACTGSAMIVKNKNTLIAIENNSRCYYVNSNTPRDDFPGYFDLQTLEERHLKRLARIFYRYKPIFLSLRQTDSGNKKVVNKIRRYAKTQHAPLQKGFWEECLYSTKRPIKIILDTARNSVDELTNFKKVQLMQAIRKRLVGASANGTLYNIRTGSLYIRKNYTPKIDFDFLNTMYAILEDSLVKSLSKKATPFIVKEGVHLTCPTSEKNFLGNYPMGTFIDFENSDNILGIYWREEWGARDFDLHAVTCNGYHIGWNGGYCHDHNDIIYSGDMVRANPEATELVYFKKDVPDLYVNINAYNAFANSKYKLFVAKENVEEKIEEFRPRYGRRAYTDETKAIMVDPNNVVFEALLTFNDMGQETIGYVHNSKLYLMKLKSGQTRVTAINDRDNVIHQVNRVQAESYIELVPLLEKAGFKKITAKSPSVQEASTRIEVDVTGLSKEEAVKKVKEHYDKSAQEFQENIGLDLTNPEKDTLISLFAN